MCHDDKDNANDERLKISIKLTFNSIFSPIFCVDFFLFFTFWLFLFYIFEVLVYEHQNQLYCQRNLCWNSFLFLTKDGKKNEPKAIISLSFQSWSDLINFVIKCISYTRVNGMVALSFSLGSIFGPFFRLSSFHLIYLVVWQTPHIQIFCVESITKEPFWNDEQKQMKYQWI